MALTRLKKHQTIPFIDISDNGTPEYARIGKSTIFDLTLNANTVTSNYIEDEMPTDNVDHYKPAIAQELATIEGDKAFDYMYNMIQDLPTGQGLVHTVLLCFAGEKMRAWRVPATVILKNLNTVDEKILFDLNFGGNIERGTFEIADGQPVFTPAG